MKRHHLGDNWIAALVATALLAPSVRASAQVATAEAPPSTEPVHRLHWNATADEEPSASHRASTESRDVRRDIPIVAYAYTAYGTTAKTFGAQGYGQGLAASGQGGVLGGGATVWGSPIDRLTLIADAQRTLWGEFSPSLAGVLRLAGDARDGWSVGALGKFKIDGFAAGPAKNEIESEIELGALLSFVRSGFYLDLNAVGGRGTGDEGDMDAEGRLRLGRNLGRLFRLGLDGQTRVRVGGPRYLPNGRTWDFTAGPQFLMGTGSFYGAVTAGPTTTGLLVSTVGFAAVLTVGGAT